MDFLTNSVRERFARFSTDDHKQRLRSLQWIRKVWVDLEGYEPLRAAVIAGAGLFYGEMKMQEGKALIESNKDFRNDVEQEVEKLFS